TTCESNRSREIASFRTKPVSYVMPLARMCQPPSRPVRHYGTDSTLLDVITDVKYHLGRNEPYRFHELEKSMARETRKHLPTGRTRRRGAALDAAIRRAAADELAASGYAGLTMEKVASRAGTNKNALYRRWPNRLALGIAAYRQLSRNVPLP